MEHARCPACLQHPNETHGVAQPCPRGFAPVLTGAIWAAAAELLPAVRQLADRYNAQGTRRDSLERNEGAAVGDSPPFVPVSQAGYTVHGRGRRRLLFRPGHCSRRKALYTAKYINLHPSYRRPGVQPSPSLSEIILDFGTCEVMNNMQYVICNGAMTALRWASSTQTRRSSSARRRSPTFSLSLREWLRHRG